MKTQEEIKVLAGNLANPNVCKTDNWIEGYMQCQEDMAKELYKFGKLVLDTFHSEGRTHSGKDRLARIKFDEWFNSLNKED